MFGTLHKVQENRTSVSILIAACQTFVRRKECVCFIQTFICNIDLCILSTTNYSHYFSHRDEVDKDFWHHALRIFFQPSKLTAIETRIRVSVFAPIPIIGSSHVYIKNSFLSILISRDMFRITCVKARFYISVVYHKYPDLDMFQVYLGDVACFRIPYAKFATNRCLQLHQSF